MNTIIKSLLDNDLYKFTMLQAFYHFEKNTEAKYTFSCRTLDIRFDECINKIKEQLSALCNLTFTANELKYLDSLSYIKPGFTEFLKDFKFNEKYVNIELDSDKQLKVNIQGPIIYTTLFEVPLLSIINECYFSNKISEGNAWRYGEKNLKSKIDFLKGSNGNIKLSEFGTRRRFSFEWHENIINKLIESNYSGFVGTSNVYFAKKYNLKPIGTMAHEWIMAHTGVTSLEESTTFALKRWLDFYKGELGIALTDTFTTDYFLTEFGESLAGKYFGVRHDSGDWKKWGNKIIRNYEKLGIDPLTKTLVFSDGLDFTTTGKIYNEFHNKTKLLFGIGTDLTNDVGVTPMQIVIKMIESNGKPVIKVSDTPGKIICADELFQYSAISFLNKFKKGA
jgi:nicotinate phosphoribosyltransferase